jgi:hypothetical protein
MKIRPVGTELLHADGQTGMTRLNTEYFAHRLPLGSKQKQSFVLLHVR